MDVDGLSSAARLSINLNVKVKVKMKRRKRGVGALGGDAVVVNECGGRRRKERVETKGTNERTARTSCD